jgi:hypothetical protein
MPTTVELIKAAIRSHEIVEVNTGLEISSTIRIYDARECPAKRFLRYIEENVECQVLVEWQDGNGMWINIGKINEVVYTGKYVTPSNTDEAFVYEYAEPVKDDYFIGRRFISHGPMNQTPNYLCIASGTYQKLKPFLDSSPEGMRGWLEQQYRSNPAFQKPSEGMIRLVSENYDTQLKFNVLYPFPFSTLTPNVNSKNLNAVNLPDRDNAGPSDNPKNT